ncbi:MAG: thrombospondin type 3 repeat-containing protein, partial [Planctomycetes bacterium]|nr:thrombospondin type 3 repeat-containing protein [Planctomycetota bacterium]
GNLLKNQKFSLHTQKFDIDGRPVLEKKDLVSANLLTGETGGAVLYIAPDHPYDRAKRGTYALSTIGTSKANYTEYDIVMPPDEDLFLEYQLSDAVVELRNSADQPIANQAVELYGQARSAGGSLELGKKIASGKTDQSGIVRFEQPAGYYALVIKDSLGQNNIFWQNRIQNRQRNFIKLSPNLTRVKVAGPDGAVKPAGTAVAIYTLAEDENGRYYKNNKLKAIKTTAAGYAEVSLAAKPYLFTVTSGKIEYGQALYAENGKLQAVTVAFQPANLVTADKRYILAKPAAATPLAEKLKGYILLQAQSRGETWYVGMGTKQRYYLKDGAAAYTLLRKFGTGITNNDLKKIPIGLDERFEEFDYDGDFVPDKMEEAVGTDMYDSDSDNDGYDDGEEIKNGFDPKGSGRLPLDNVFAGKQKGKILLQVESRGEAWYVNPKDGRRYYMQDGDSAYEIMRFLSLGITNVNLEQIEVGTIGD